MQNVLVNVFKIIIFDIGPYRKNSLFLALVD